MKDAKESEGVLFFKTFGHLSAAHENWHAGLNKVRNNDPDQKYIALYGGGILSSLSDYGWKLIDTYIARNRHLRHLEVDAESNDQMASIFRNLTGSKSIELLELGMDPPAGGVFAHGHAPSPHGRSFPSPEGNSVILDVAC